VNSGADPINFVPGLQYTATDNTSYVLGISSVPSVQRGPVIFRQQNINQCHSFSPPSHPNVNVPPRVHDIVLFELVHVWHLFSPICNVIMPYDSYSGEPEPKLLAIDCFPTFFTPPPPPHYQVIMAANTRYHRLPEDNHASFESPTRDAELLLGPLSSGKSLTPPKKERKLSYHPTLFLRLVGLGLLIASLILFVAARRPRSLSAIIFICIAIVRNFLVVFHHYVARFIRIRIELELINGAAEPKRPARSCPGWLKQGPIHVALDLILAFVLFITVIIATQGSYHWDRRSVIPACILAWVAM
jgi:hypothetical protein